MFFLGHQSERGGARRAPTKRVYLNFRKLPSFKRTVKFLLEGLIVLLKCHPFNPD